jgi:phosphoribosylaminoimidazolecarboxamide formyltransferase/IMP cyclohydrolase
VKQAPITRALISVSDKTGVVPLARRLAALGISLLSTGGTARVLRENDIDVTEVSEYTGFPEILGGRVKTLHPRIHAGLLARGDADAGTLAAHDIAPIGLLVVNLYPFRETTSDPDCTLETAVENIDIGGPAMLRAAAKNHRHVLMMVDPADYEPVLSTLESGQAVTDAMRHALAVRAFGHTAEYDRAVFEWLDTHRPAGEAEAAGSSATAPTCATGTTGGDAPDCALPETLTLSLQRHSSLRYGENPHQAAAIYGVTGLPAVGDALVQHAGKALSFNNIVDAETALGCVDELDGCACVIVKHANPCGAAVADDPVNAYERALAADPTSAFGGIVAFNRPIDAQVVEAILAKQFVEVIVCPEVRGDVTAVLAAKPAVRLLTAPTSTSSDARRLELRPMRGGLLVQQVDTLRVGADDLRVVTRRRPDAAALAELLFAWTLVKWVKSNAIVYTRDLSTVGIGAGQTSRIDSARFGAARAKARDLDLTAAVMASDAFFPFRDSIDDAAAHGIASVIQPGGSKRDDEVIAAADEHDIAMVFTGHRHFRH